MIEMNQDFVNDWYFWHRNSMELKYTSYTGSENKFAYQIIFTLCHLNIACWIFTPTIKHMHEYIRKLREK